MPIRDSHAAQLLMCCCTLMLLVVLAHPVAASSRGAGMPPVPTPNAAPAPATPPTAAQSPAPVTTPPPAATPTTPAASGVRHVWNVEYILWAPDCKQHGMIGINGKFPGPNITAIVGDTITVVVNNKLHTEGVVIHWHGIRQIGTPWADGTASISQCPIDPGETFIYEFKADKPGTYFYHGHFGMQRAAGLYGSLIVNVPEEDKARIERRFKYDAELEMLLLSDWYHEAVYAQAAGLERKDDHFQWIGEPQTLLINGKGQFGCTLGDVGEFQKGINRDATKCDRKAGEAVEAACGKICGSGGEAVKDSCMVDMDCGGKEKEECEAECKRKGKDSEEEKAKVVCEDEKAVNCAVIRRSECGPFCTQTECGPVVLDVEPGKTYRLRIASTTSLSALNVQVQGHKLTVVEAEGNLVEPVEDLESIDIYSGESYSVLLKTTAEKQGSSPYWISVGVIGRTPKTLPALAVLRYTGSQSELPAGVPPATPAWNDLTRSKKLARDLRAQEGSDQPPTEVHRRIFMLNTQELVDGQIKWAINNFSLSLPATPYLGAYAYRIEDKVLTTTVEPPDNFLPGYDVKKPPYKQKPEAVLPVTVSNQVYNLKHDDIIDVVLQNADMRKDGVSESHPWHLHGHDFWVLGYGDGLYNDDMAAMPAVLNTAPPLRNTVVVFPHGWTMIRFKADNPGVWAFHCHIEPHLHMGMGVVFAEGMEKLRELNVPREAVSCGAAKSVAGLPLAPAAAPSPPS